MHIDPSRLVRRETEQSGKLSTSTIIIIAVVCGSVVILASVLFVWRNLARSCRRSRKVPLPPVQDLAHHREQQLAAFADRNASRPATWVDGPAHHPRLYSSHFLSASASNASLIRGSSDYTTPSRSPTRENSWAVEDATSAESSPSPYPSPLSTEDLRAPNPSYFSVGMNAHNSMASVVSDSSEGGGGNGNGGSALTTSPSELTPSVESSASLVRTAAPPARARPPRTPRSRSRPMSMVSSSGTMHSVHSAAGTTLRGPAHSIHSNVQIVLPAPLAPELYPAQRPTDDRFSTYGGGMSRVSSFYALGEGDRRSVADPWLSGASGSSRSQSRADLREASGSSSRLSSAGPRPGSALRPRSSLPRVASSSSLHSQTDAASDSASVKARRARSQPPAQAFPFAPSQSSSLAPSRAPSPLSANATPPRSPPPPVPRIPSVYGNVYGMPTSDEQRRPGPSRAATAEESDSEGRGRPPRKQASLPTGAVPPIQDPLSQSEMAVGQMVAYGGGEWAGQTDRPPPQQRQLQPWEQEQVQEPVPVLAERRTSKLRKQRSRSRGARS
ncbi:hypothetical protein C8Q77DRAFT_1152201 [Trametes polyzona]|nr:hypothetical protein C8Q77DRAFT_1152201 [Trametes polyzona]